MLNKNKYIKVSGIEEPKNKINPGFFALIICLFFLSFLHRGILIVLLFEVLDYLKQTIKYRINTFPVDFNFVFGVAAAYYASPLFSMVILFLAQVNRFMFGFFEKRYFAEALRSTLIFFAVPFLNVLPFMTVAYTMLSLKYILQYASEFLFTGTIVPVRVHYHLFNIITSAAVFYILDNISFMFT